MERRTLLRSVALGVTAGISSQLLSARRAEAAPDDPSDPAGEGWENVGGTFSSASITPVSWGPDRIDLFGIAGSAGSTGAWHKAWRGSQGWDPAGQGWASI